MAAFMMPRLGLRLAGARASAPALVPWTLLLLPRTITAAAGVQRSLSTSSHASPRVTVAATSSSLHSSSLVRRPTASLSRPSPSAIVNLLAPISKRFQSTTVYSASEPSSNASTTKATDTHPEAASTPLVSKPVVAYHLYALAFLVYAIVVVGGLTRLTESGLSITEWNPGFKGMRLPMTNAEWEAEWDKYKQTPEFVLLNSKMSLDDFKSIYMWEWGHRVLGRIIGVAFVLPAVFFVTSKWVAPGTRWKLLAIAAGIGFQGFLGWYMVESGLTVPDQGGRAKEAHVHVPVIKDDHPNSTANMDGGKMRFDASIPTTTDGTNSSAPTLVAAAEWTPRVSHFRLAMHMGTAFLVYLAMLHTGLAVQRDYKAAGLSGSVSGVRARTSAMLTQLANTLNHPLLRSHSRLTKLVTGLVFTTAMSGALVAGLDAGLVYNEFPTMGEGRIAPPMDELMDPRFAQRPDGSDKVWTNLTQNPVTVQLIHRTLAVTTACTVLALAWKTHRLSRVYSATTAARTGALLPALPPRVLQLANASVAVVAAQVTLGITTLIYMVPIPLASAHQAGSLALLSVLVALLSALRPIPPKILARALHTNTNILNKVVHSQPARSAVPNNM